MKGRGSKVFSESFYLISSLKSLSPQKRLRVVKFRFPSLLNINKKNTSLIITKQMGIFLVEEKVEGRQVQGCCSAPWCQKNQGASALPLFTFSLSTGASVAQDSCFSFRCHTWAHAGIIWGKGGVLNVCWFSQGAVIAMSWDTILVLNQGKLILNQESFWSSLDLPRLDILVNPDPFPPTNLVLANFWPQNGSYKLIKTDI